MAGKQNCDFFKEEREMLKSFKLNIASNSTPSTSISTPSNLKVKKYSVIEPKYELVTSVKEIVKLKSIYVHLLLNNHIANFMEEIKFVLEIINKRTMCDCASKSDAQQQKQQTIIEKIFSTYHNCFHFVYLVFEELFIQNLFINFLDYKTLNHIFSNVYLFDYKKNDSSTLITLKEVVEQAYLGRYSDCTQKSASSDNTNFVFFQPDTDSKSNFPNDQSFSIFRKQRDDFYRLFKNYHDNNLAASISVDRKVQGIFVSSIRSMLNMSKDVGNSYHLARLFVSQLMKSCCNSDSRNGKEVSNGLNNSNNRVNSNPTNRILNDQDKFKRLSDRFVKKSSHNDMHLTSNLLDESFTSKERFFRDFIYYSDSHSFNQQLKLILKSQIIELTTSDIFNFGENCSINDECDKGFLVHLARLNLLAKFLGFLCFYPLDTSINNEKMMEKKEFLTQQTSLRTLSPAKIPFLDIETYLVNSMEKHVLIVAVPWVVEFLLFADQITLSLTYYENVLALLCLIYKFYLPNLTTLTAQLNAQVSYIRLFIQLFIEKLFSIKKFSAPVRLQTLVDNMKEKNQIEVFNQMFSKIKPSSDDSSMVRCLEELYLDFHNEVFDFELISAFFPQFSRLITDQFKQFSNEVRKITPTTVSVKQTTPTRQVNNAFTSMNTLNTSSAIQTEAEQCFLNIHSNSLKKCIYFLNDRISATCIKRIQCDIFPGAKSTHFASFFASNPELQSDPATLEVKKNIDLTAKLADSIRAECKAFLPEYSNQKVATIFPMIMLDDLDESVVAFAMQICLRQIEHRCISWIELNISNDAVYTELVSFMRQQNEPKTMKAQSSSSSEIVEQQNVSLLYSDFEKVFNELRETLNCVLQKRFDQLDNGQIISLLSKLKSVRKMTFLPVSNVKLFDMTSLDLAICIIAFNPQAMNDGLLDAFMAFWTDRKATFPRVICAKNLHIVNQTKSRITTWVKFEFLLKRMLKAAVINFSDIEECTFGLLKQDWPQNVLVSLASLLSALVEDARQNKLTFDEQSSHEILEWLSWFCSQKDDQ